MLTDIRFFFTKKRVVFFRERECLFCSLVTLFRECLHPYTVEGRERRFRCRKVRGEENAYRDNYEVEYLMWFHVSCAPKG